MSKLTTEIMWTCCDDAIYDTVSEVIQHLIDVHGLRQPIRATKRGVMHLDGEDGFSLNTDEYTIGTLVLHKTVKTFHAESEVTP